MKKLGFVIVLLCLLFVPHFPKVKTFALSDGVQTSAKAALLLDSKSGEIVFEKNSSKRLPIASMTKLASLSLIFDSMDRGEFDEETLIKVSKHAADTEGSSAFLDEGSEYKAKDLIMTVIVCSANDSTVALAEKVAGSESEFVRKMNNMAKDMGLKDTSFMNCTGLPAIDHYSSVHDVAQIYDKIAGNKMYKKFSKIWITELVHPSGRKTDIVNTNRLIKTYEGCESGKTGFTNDAGYCLAASAMRGGMRLIGVVMGEPDSKTRFNDMANLFNFGFNNFENKVVISKDKPICEIVVKGSKNKEKVKVYPQENFIKFLKKGEEFNCSINCQLKKQSAPLNENDQVGELFVLDENNIVIEQIPLIVKENVAKIKLKDILNKIIQKI